MTAVREHGAHIWPQVQASGGPRSAARDGGFRERRAPVQLSCNVSGLIPCGWPEGHTRGVPGFVRADFLSRFRLLRLREHLRLGVWHTRLYDRQAAMIAPPTTMTAKARYGPVGAGPVRLPAFRLFAASTFGGKPRLPDISNTRKTHVRRSAGAGCVTSPTTTYRSSASWPRYPIPASRHRIPPRPSLRAYPR